jgi:hypothetical protein
VFGLGSLIGGVGSLIGGLFGASTDSGVAKTIAGTGANAGAAIEKTGAGAASQTTAAGQAAVKGVNQAVTAGQTGVNTAVSQGQAGVTGAETTANANAGKVLGTQLAVDSPYLQEGAQGTANLEKLAANGGFQAPTAAQAAATPGEQFQMQQGLQGVEQQLGASGGAATGGALKALTQYGQGVASTYYQNAFNNSLNAYNTNVNTNMGMAGQGLQGTAMANNALSQYGSTTNQNTMGAGYYNSNLGMQGAQTNSATGMQGASLAGQFGTQTAETAGNQNLQGAIAGGNMYMQGAEGAGAARIGASNSLTQGLGGLGNAIGGGLMMGGLGGGFGGGSYFGGGGNPYAMGSYQSSGVPMGSYPGGYS